MIVIADAGPLRYLIVIEQVHLLPLLYGSIVVPPGVVHELTRESTSDAARAWMGRLPDWVTVQAPQKTVRDLLSADGPSLLGLGELEAMALAEELSADVLLADDEAARQAASERNIPVQGTLGVLDLAAEHGLLADFPEAIENLRRTNFRASRKLYDYFLDREANRKIKRTE